MRGAILLVILAGSRSVLAQGPTSPEHRKHESSVFLGVNLGNDLQFSTPVTGSSVETTRTVGMRYIAGLQAGVRAGENFNELWSADVEYSFSNQRLHLTNLSPEIQDLSLGHSIHHVSYDISYSPVTTARRFRPYARMGAGVGLFYISGESKHEAGQLGVNLRDSWVFAVNVGGGFKYLVRDQAALIFNFKDQISGVPAYGLSRSAQVRDGQYHPGVAAKGFFHDLQINLGLEFQWDQ